jgi:hypothetical protein
MLFYVCSDVPVHSEVFGGLNDSQATNRSVLGAGGWVSQRVFPVSYWFPGS